MKRFWGKLTRNGRISRETAIGFLAANVTVPGFGTMLSGKIVTGLLQATLGLAGFAVSTITGLRMIQWMLGNWQRIQSPDADPLETLSETWLAIRWPLAGLVAFGIAWLWSMATSWSLLRKLPKEDNRRVPPPL